METDIKQNSKRILESSREALDYSIKRKKEVASGGNKEDLIDYDRKIEFHLLKIKDNLTEVYSEIKQTPTVEGAKQLTKQPGVSGQAFNTKLSFTLRKSFLNDLNLTPEDLKKFIKNQEKSKTPEEEKGYTTYKSNAYAKISNAVVERITASVIKSHKDQFKSLFSALNSANMKIFSRSYIDMMVFSAFLAFPVFTVLAFIILNKILLSLLLGVLAMPLTFLMMYGYPFSVVNSRKRQIKRELVFAIIHMSAVAGSGAEPSKIFKLLIKSKEYKELDTEFKRIMNYMNLFGYSLSTSLKAVAKTTPSPEFEELLHGIVSTIETGGDIKNYLSNKSDEALVQFSLDQKKYLEAISAYSDMYTGLLIAAPLLFVVTLAILEKISPDLGGVPIATISSLGVFVLMPILNVIFALFLEASGSEI
ncbi:hypothetical protein HOA59_03130 [archaeon]|jgi:archaeal flagellar protein FlaJ|nr:hypothetical protein [archaeon]MBT6824402.1 hypothetical protein [archaeon]MBT7107319.1 hypothetical protein [archaeon]MBT7297378.1 hypothetical protein [archaeon]